MKVIVKDDYEKMSKEAANMIKEEINKKPNIVLGLATGSTPVGMYKELIRMHKEEGLDFSKVTTFNLDEYVGLDENHPNSYHYFMKDIFFNHVNINMDNTFIPNGKAEDLERHCKEYDKLIEKKGGIDVQILGIGENGHIAFNEPDKELNVGTSVVNLTQSTIEANSRFFDSIDEVPTKAISMGIGTIMKAKKIILLANGKRKSEVIKKLLKGDKITTYLPASMLLLHSDVTVIVDKEAYNG
ncbi:glucosamine-6-phosphate deaminase [Keratinibaculum paraultunense]|uniref:Glucosamine-6-phosphate deaminase n=1 Tax=Keratinibaculum paraultunense TaxID=1278232 RepID=A0A4R3KYV2_9FIRM|nr:glucosamine-6-phosphate deaminase [Keratinibaculum paraultunense]QQY78882.1 glucosamine-6-phosphate deaminase [Keratinibaculum paraultunense]TCS90494.1 glucosamine-6-phosphate deaminase [Keratinibaculum paraultunense]